MIPCVPIGVALRSASGRLVEEMMVKPSVLCCSGVIVVVPRGDGRDADAEVVVNAADWLCDGGMRRREVR